MSYYAVGDIHGQSGQLKILLSKLLETAKNDDVIIFLGDYIDRGQCSSAVIDTLIALRGAYSNIIFLRGNHEQLIIDSKKESLAGLRIITDRWIQNGGDSTILSYSNDSTLVADSSWPELIPEAHWDFLSQTILEYVTDSYHFVHAGLLPRGEAWPNLSPSNDPRLWIKGSFINSNDDFGGRVVVYGHTLTGNNGMPAIQINKIGIDTGAVFGGPLTCAVLDERRLDGSLPAPRFVQAFSDGLCQLSFG